MISELQQPLDSGFGAKSEPSEVLEGIDLNGKTALVTGGYSGIGLETTRALSNCGARVIVPARRRDVAIKELEGIIDKEDVLNLDLADPSSVTKFVDEFLETGTNLDILINNAGAAWGAPFDTFPENGWDKVMNTNVKAVFFLIQKLIKILESSGNNSDPSRIINIGSIDGVGIPRAETYSYPASKAAIHQLTRVLANRLAHRNINVNAIAPGPFQSNMMAHSLREYGEQIKKSVPRGRIGEPEDMAGTSIFLSSRASAYITGSIIPVDGGSLIARRHME